MIIKTLSAAVLALLLLTPEARASLRPGEAFDATVSTFKDGDSFVVTTTTGQRHEVRLWGVDAPEGRQSCGDGQGRDYACGRAASSYKRNLTQGQMLRCSVVTPRDAFGRVIARCTVNGTDLGESLVRAGHALDWPRYSQSFYRQAQDEAQRAGRGVWQGQFTEPWVYRSEQRR